MNTKTKDIRVPPYLYLTMFSATDPVSSGGGSDDGSSSGGGGGTNNTQGGLDTTTTIIIAVVVSIIVLIISGAVIAFVCHRRRSRGNKGGLPRSRGAKDNTYAEKVHFKNRKPHPSPRPESSQSVRENGQFKCKRLREWYMNIVAKPCIFLIAALNIAYNKWPVMVHCTAFRFHR